MRSLYTVLLRRFEKSLVGQSNCCIKDHFKAACQSLIIFMRKKLVIRMFSSNEL